MEKKRNLIIMCIVLVAVLATVIVCVKLLSKNNDNVGDNGTETIPGVSVTTTGATAQKISVEYTKRDEDASIDGEKIEFSDDGVSSESKGVVINETSVTITQEGSYVLSGSCRNGEVIISADENADIHIILNGINLKCNDNAPIRETDGSKVVVTVADGTDNFLEDGSEYYKDTFTSNEDSSSLDETDNASVDEQTEQEDNVSACIWACGGITFNGSGNLYIKSNCANGIKTKNKLKIIDGNITINSEKNGIVGKDCIIIKNGNITISAKKDGIKSNRTDDETKGYIVIEDGVLNISAEDDCIQAVTTIQIDGASFTLNAKDKGIVSDSVTVVNEGNVCVEKCNEGIQSCFVIINDGTVDITSSDDGINATTGESGTGMFHPEKTDSQQENDKTCSITINGGKVNVNASGDGLDSNGNIYFNGGETYIDGPVDNGNGPLDSGDYNNEIYMNGGTLIAIGSSSMAEFPCDESSQYVLAMTPSAQTAGTVITIKDTQENEIFSYSSKKEFASICFSSSDLEKDETYTVYLDDTKLTSITVSDIVSTDGNTNTQGGFGGGKGPKGNRGDRPLPPENEQSENSNKNVNNSL